VSGIAEGRKVIAVIVTPGLACGAVTAAQIREIIRTQIVLRVIIIVRVEKRFRLGRRNHNSCHTTSSSSK